MAPLPVDVRYKTKVVEAAPGFYYIEEQPRLGICYLCPIVAWVLHENHSVYPIVIGNADKTGPILEDEFHFVAPDGKVYGPNEEGDKTLEQYSKGEK
jgi:hypothetical protein